MKRLLIGLAVISGCSAARESGDVGPTNATIRDVAEVGGADGSVDDLGEASLGVVQTEGGRVRGESLGDVWQFLGVRYAAAERFGRPLETSWSDVREATQVGPVCPQLGNTTAEPNRSWGPQPPECSECTNAECRHVCWSEDCLNLNLWTPGLDGSRPVMVWIHGGSYVYGSGALYHGEYLARDGDVVVVTINYRLGALGMFAHPALEESLNFGMLDEMRALQWVRDNISAFGGDPDNVTVFGESAGGASVCALVTSDAASGLFDKAIMQSGSCSWAPRHRDTTMCTAVAGCPDLATIDAQGLYDCVAMECLGSRIAELLGCVGPDPIQCLRDAPALDVLSALPQNIGFGRGVLWSRFLDGETMVAAPGEALYLGNFTHVPFMLGSTLDEATLFFSPRGPDVTTVAQLEAYIARWGACADEIAPHYPATTDTEAATQYLRLLADTAYTCPTAWEAQNVAFYQPDVWMYQFTHVPWVGGIDINGEGFRLGAYHSAEIPYIFGNIVEPAKDPSCAADASGAFHCCDDLGRCFEAPDVPLSAEIMGLWSAFAHTSNPGAPWPPYDLVERRHLMLEAALPTADHLRGGVCDMWLAVSSHFLQGSGACE